MLMGFSEPSVHLLHSLFLCSPVVKWGKGPVASVQKSLRLILLLSISPSLMRQLGVQLGLLGTWFRLGLISRSDSRPGQGPETTCSLRGDARKDGHAGKSHP